jgi:alkylhydroperoxidase family enzyme
VSPSTGAARSARAPATAAGVTAATPERPRRRVALIGGKALQSARCVQWKRGTARQRAAIVSTLQVVVGGPTPFGRANTLPPGEATALFDRACSRYYARSFLLYELYTRASGFHGPPPPKL